MLVRGLCPSCFAEVYGVARLPARVEAEVCRYCFRVRIAGRWVEAYSFEEAVERVARWTVERARPVDPVERVEFEGVDFETLPNWRTRVTVRVRGLYRGYTIVGGAPVDLRLKPTICPVCKVRVSGEYDTLLQVRGGDAEEVEGLVARVIEEEGLVHQTVDLIRGKDGVDVYFTNPGAARKVAKRLQRLLGGRISRMQHETVGTDSSGRRRSRRTLLLRID